MFLPLVIASLRQMRAALLSRRNRNQFVRALLGRTRTVPAPLARGRWR